MLSCSNAFVEFMNARSIYQRKDRKTRVAMRWILFKPIFCGDKFSNAFLCKCVILYILLLIKVQPTRKMSINLNCVRHDSSLACAQS